MAFTTELTRRFGLRYPVVSGPMGAVAGGREAELRGALPEQATSYAKAAAAGDLSTAVVWAGEGLDLVRDIQPAEQILARIMREAEETRRRLVS